MQTVRHESNVEIDKNPVDPDELQLMDECNWPWVQAWKHATVRANWIKAVTTSGRTLKQ